MVSNILFILYPTEYKNMTVLEEFCSVMEPHHFVGAPASQDAGYGPGSGSSSSSVSSNLQITIC